MAQEIEFKHSKKFEQIREENGYLVIPKSKIRRHISYYRTMLSVMGSAENAEINQGMVIDAVIQFIFTEFESRNVELDRSMIYAILKCLGNSNVYEQYIQAECENVLIKPTIFPSFN